MIRYFDHAGTKAILQSTMDIIEREAAAANSPKRQPTALERQALYESGFWGDQGSISDAVKIAREQRERQAAATKPALSSKPAPAPIAKAAAPKPTPPPLSTSERAAADAARRQAAKQEAERRAIAEQTAAVQRQARIDASWRRAHARASGRPVADSKPAPGAKAENYGWGKAHANVAKRYGRTAAK